MRRAVLGDAHVDRSIAGANDFTRDFQSLITRYAWGTIWSATRLEPANATLAHTCHRGLFGAMGRVQVAREAALAHELELSDLKETLLQTAIYAGVPAANTGFQIAGEEIEKLKGWLSYGQRRQGHEATQRKSIELLTLTHLGRTYGVSKRCGWKPVASGLPQGGARPPRGRHVIRCRLQEGGRPGSRRRGRVATSDWY